MVQKLSVAARMNMPENMKTPLITISRSVIAFAMLQFMDRFNNAHTRTTTPCNSLPTRVNSNLEPITCITVLRGRTRSLSKPPPETRLGKESKPRAKHSLIENTTHTTAKHNATSKKLQPFICPNLSKRKYRPAYRKRYKELTKGKQPERNPVLRLCFE
jgi:hypothetical protein